MAAPTKLPDIPHAFKSLPDSQTVTASGSSSVTVNNFVRNYYQLPVESGRQSTPSMENIKQMIDAVIATTQSESEAARLEICRAYLFNPPLRGNLEKKMLAQISKQGEVMV